MNFAFLPDLFALTILIVILWLLRRRHPQEHVDMWLLGLFFTFVEALAHIFYAPGGLPSTVLHVIVMDCYLLAGVTFIWAGGDLESDPKRRLAYLVLNTAPLLAMNTTYGLHLFSERAFLPWIAVGVLVSGATAFYLKRSWKVAVLQICGWVAMGFLVHNGKFREAVYWSLCYVYSVAGYNFQQRLPRRSTGRLAILTGFFIWAAFFLVHPLIVPYRTYADIASHIWNMQKSLISIGMILVMLEEQVSNNKWLALHDELTGLPNRRSFEDGLTNALDRCRRMSGKVALVMLDLNDFKRINDSLGHHAGDAVLRGVAKNLRECVQEADSLARLGGDEFTLIACDLKSENAISVLADAIRKAVARPMVIDSTSVSVTASLGIAVYPDDAEDASTLLRVADQRMYLLKHRPSGRLKMKAELKPHAAYETGSVVQ
jgi:diguanylate cyclase (GGDEF)-like protein